MEKQIGAEGKLVASVKDGKIRLEIQYDGKQLDGGAWVASDSDMLVDALAELIPGNSAVEQGAVAILKTALKNVTV